ncbi:MAG: diguanylate cyclase [Ferrovum myxofaciens]|uniref:sensor domain-containing protein n=1 Tax=Ferrovum myxofaciens TaxID=416213 RepID=UPI0023539E78|nr:GGDEF domain-containing protein [Ferrovum myxofaciens]QKE40604.1 MAG: diguanylate cyclase [Ferrovum myxofaciens]
MTVEHDQASGEFSCADVSVLIQSIINALPVPIFVKNSKGIYVYCNVPFEKYVGKKSGEIVGRSVYDLWDAELAKVYHEADNRLFRAGGEEQYEAKVKYADGSIHDVIFHKAIFPFSDENYMAGAILDISDRKTAERELERIALTDSLTGVANRHHLYAALDDACRKAARRNCIIAVMGIDLDGFKEVNDTYGHLVGDEVLVKAASRIKESIRASDLLARPGGDEFIILFDGLERKDPAYCLAETILQKLSEEMELQGHPIMLNASIGIAFYPDHGTNPQDLLKYADLALYEAKREGKGCFRSLVTP